MSVFTNPAGSTLEESKAYTRAVLELVGDRNPIDVLRNTPTELRQILDILPSDMLTAPEVPGKWSISQVLVHLADAELVWAYRMRMVLGGERPQLQGYDQDAWASRLGSEEADPKHALEEFAVVRRANLRLIDRASATDLARVGVHAERGEESVDLMVRLYAGHDLLHLRQIDRIRQTVMG